MGKEHYGQFARGTKSQYLGGPEQNGERTVTNILPYFPMNVVGPFKLLSRVLYKVHTFQGSKLFFEVRFPSVPNCAEMKKYDDSRADQRQGCSMSAQR